MSLLPWHRPALTAQLARRDRMPHALLLTGPEGYGKVEFARALAQSLLCENADAEGVACGQCAACGWFGEGNHPDYREVLPENLMEEDAESEPVASDSKPEKKSAQITIEQIRALQQFITLSTHRSGWRLLVLHPAEAMNPQAANALLKTLEEPTPSTLMILVSDQPGRLMATVRSRCQVVQVPVCDEALARDWLVAQGIDARAAGNLLQQAGGAPLKALAFSEDDYQSARRQILSALAEPAKSDWLGLAGAFEKGDLKNVLDWTHTWVCDLLLTQQTGDVRHHPDFAQQARRLADQASPSALFRMENDLRQRRRHLQHPLNARLWLEQMLLSYAASVASQDSR
jgi:DNA polymerase III subunit delta'